MSFPQIFLPRAFFLSAFALSMPATSLLAHRVPFDEKIYLNLADNQGYQASRLKHYCLMWGDEKECQKQLDAWKKDDPTRIDSAVACQERFFGAWKFEAEDLKPPLGVWNQGYYLKNDKIKKEHRFEYGPELRSRARDHRLVQQLSYANNLYGPNFTEKQLNFFGDFKASGEQGYEMPWYAFEPNSLCFKDEEYCWSEEGAVLNTKYEGKKSKIPAAKKGTILPHKAERADDQIRCAENRYSVLTHPKRDEILRAERKEKFLKVQKEALLAEHKICDVAYFGKDFCKSASRYLKGVRVLD